MESNRVNKNQITKRIITKRLVSENLLSLINFGVGVRIIGNWKRFKIVNKEKEFLRLNIVCSDDGEEEKKVIENKAYEDENSFSLNNSD